MLLINAAINITDNIVDASVDQLRATLETNTIAVHAIVQAFLPLIRAGSAKKLITLGAATGTFPTV